MGMASFNDKINAWELAKGEYKWMVAAPFADIRCIVTQKVAKARKDKANDAMKLLLSWMRLELAVSINFMMEIMRISWPTRLSIIVKVCSKVTVLFNASNSMDEFSFFEVMNHWRTDKLDMSGSNNQFNGTG